MGDYHTVKLAQAKKRRVTQFGKRITITDAPYRYYWCNKQYPASCYHAGLDTHCFECGAKLENES